MAERSQMHPLRPDTGVQRYSIEVILRKDGKIVDSRKRSVKHFDAMKVFKAVKTLVECTR